ncbi:hypothetical protein J6TS1_31710 [Siminovitchia terrae]|uniref:DUF4179 domain-containing protein n=1 Tax=Siminovitchia terrae TaxID=1914933 RepID=A0ABQ4L0A0_SIMTE|nr:DUF4179 domain-containing protein [Siminovitchia terrae]GIN97301.1 hypothetical protein J6TS1_31710 [Siminovitchia terrae]
MKCPTVDELSLYVDDLVTGHESVNIDDHLEGCIECKRVVKALMEEHQFIKETLQTPTLPDDFDSLVLEQIRPYEKKSFLRKRAYWKPIALLAAGLVLAVGLTVTVNPTLAQWIGGLFSTERVDEGLRMATEAGFSERVDREVTDKGITFKIEDVVADSSRVSLSYKILNKNGKSQNIDLGLLDEGNEVRATDSLGNPLELTDIVLKNATDYGLIEFSLSEHQELDSIIVNFNLTRLNGKQGSWKLDVPVDLKESLKATKTIPFQNVKTNQHGVIIDMQKVRFTPSSFELLYETDFTKEEKIKLEKNIGKLEKQYGKEIANDMRNSYGNDIKYHIENEKMKTVYNKNPFSNGHDNELGFLQASGQFLGDIGHVAWNDSFIPIEDDHELTIVLDGIYKTEPSDFSITMKPKELKKKPVSFEYEGNFMTIKKVKLKKTEFQIEIEGYREVTGSDLTDWVLVDDKGKAYPTFRTGGTSNDKNELATTTLFSYGVNEVPKELTLRLISATRYYEVKDKWKVPLH